MANCRHLLANSVSLHHLKAHFFGPTSREVTGLRFGGVEEDKKSTRCPTAKVEMAWRIYEQTREKKQGVNGGGAYLYVIWALPSFWNPRSLR